MKILVVGGGSGGHITPAVAVVREILELKPRSQVEFWTDFKYYKNVTKLTTEIGVSWGEEAKRTGKGPYIRVRRIMAGKFHRYTGWTLKDYFVRIETTLKDIIWGNIVGFFGFLSGLIMSFCRLLPKRNRPDVMFLKGGFVCLPVGLVAQLFKIPFVIHESDVVAGLANRILMKKATKVAFGMPLDEDTIKAHPNYEYVGIPVGNEFKEVSDAKKRSFKKAFSFSANKPLVVFTGGSQGSVSINETVRQILPELLKTTSVGLIAGRKNYEDMVDLKRYENWDKAKLESDFRMWEFNAAMNELMGAADIVVSRAGATTIAELAALKKTVILVPFSSLPGGHQTKNAEKLVAKEAVMMIDNKEMVDQPKLLLNMINDLVKHPEKGEKLADNLHKEAKTNAAKRLAEIVLAEGRA